MDWEAFWNKILNFFQTTGLNILYAILALLLGIILIKIIIRLFKRVFAKTKMEKAGQKGLHYIVFLRTFFLLRTNICIFA